MTHRTFPTPETRPENAPTGASGNKLFVGNFNYSSWSMRACRPDYTVSPDPEEQFRDAFLFLADALSVARLQISDVVELTSYHVDLREHLSTFRRVKDEFMLPPYPAWSCIGTTELITPGTLVELRVMASRHQM